MSIDLFRIICRIVRFANNDHYQGDQSARNYKRTRKPNPKRYRGKEGMTAGAAALLGIVAGGCASPVGVQHYHTVCRFGNDGVGFDLLLAVVIPAFKLIALLNGNGKLAEGLAPFCREAVGIAFYTAAV